MKVRVGFVSNSSSSSFCIVGVDNKILISKLSVAEGKLFNQESEDYLNFGYNEGEVVTFYGYECEPYYAGIPLENFSEDKTIKQMKQEFIETVEKKLNVKILEHQVSILYGEAGS